MDLKTKKVSLMISILPNEVDGGDDGGGRDDGRRYFPLIFLLVTSYFSLSFDFSPLFFLLFFSISED